MRSWTFLIVAFLAASIFPLHAMAQSTTPSTTATQPTAPLITVSTDSKSYLIGDTIVMSGQVQAVVPGTPLTIQVLNPDTNLIYVDQINVSSDGKYTATIKASSASCQQCLWATSVTYTVKVQYGLPNVTAQTTFAFQSAVTPVSKIFQVRDPASQQVFGVNYTITGGDVKDMTVDAQSISLIVSINSTSDGTLKIQMPRTLIDAKTSGGQDDAFIILIDGAEVKPQSESADSNYRTLTLNFLQGDQDIEIIGTQVIPEFGPIAAAVFAVAVASIIAISARTRLFPAPKY